MLEAGLILLCLSFAERVDRKAKKADALLLCGVVLVVLHLLAAAARGAARVLTA